MSKPPEQYLDEAILMSRSLFPETEKQRHYRELLMEMSHEYRQHLMTNHNSDIARAYHTLYEMMTETTVHA
ncbi:hypothetical protein PA598K_05784 [Paenibacillus sp. 598K]|uniref:hypothetical protein n=1 Tax=Paenibacillus sp. 598K TaxID=1117987 RepID=UPI000FFAADC4|nr:hypothetical protein [Paenibacillus sp. 598K]GBF77248.1 hypothetical protein PA598K_05784 [Paenibacillus sp. 598K]